MRSEICTIYPCFHAQLGQFDGTMWQCDGCALNPVLHADTKTVRQNFFLASTALNCQLTDSPPHQAVRLLNKTRGLSNARVLSKKEKQELYALTLFEEVANLGVLNCLQKPVTIALSHDSAFRKPVFSLVQFFRQKQSATQQDHDEVVLPAIPFPEVAGVSASPGRVAHALLAKTMTLADTDATLLIGLDS